MRNAVMVVASLLGLWGSLGGASEPPLIHVTDHETLRRGYGVSPHYDGSKSQKRLKIAVFDKGFGGVTPSTMSQYLPSDTQIIKWDKVDGTVPLDDRDVHGRAMAQTVWAMMGYQEDAPQFFLVNARDTDNFARASDWAIREKVDLVLISLSFEGAGNGDGNGEVNQNVKKMDAAGILVIVAAGNYGGAVHWSQISVTRDNKVQFTVNHEGRRVKRDYLEFESRVTEDPSRSEIPPVKIVALWNDYSDRPDSGTDRDLDLYLTDETGKVLQKSELRQVTQKTENAEKNGETFSPRESLQYAGALKANQKFRIQVKVKKGVFSESSDYLRIILLHGRRQEDVFFKDASLEREILVPGDSSHAITVGATSRFSSRGPTFRPLVKPDVVLPFAEVKFGSEPPQLGTSIAAALFTGIAATLKVRFPNLTRQDLLKIVPHAIPPKPESISWEKAKDYHPTVMQILSSLLGERETKLSLVEDRIFVEVGSFPEAMRSYFYVDWRQVGSDPFQSYEFYLVARHVLDPYGRPTGHYTLRGYPRAASQNGSGAQEDPPWVRQNEDPKAYVQIVPKLEMKRDTRGWDFTPHPRKVFEILNAK